MKTSIPPRNIQNSPVNLDAITQGNGRSPAVLTKTGSGEGAFPGLSSFFSAFSKPPSRVIALLATSVMLIMMITPGLAFASDKPQRGHITGRSVVAGVLSFAIWPGIGQAVNDDKGKKVATHAALGLLPPYRFWSGYDALVDRKGGYWKGKI